jgi:hypothetical protein
MITGFRRTAAAAAAVIALGAGGAAWAVSSASASTTASSISKCSAGDLAVSVDADSADGTAGTTFFNLEFTNISHSTCALFGFPGVSAVNGNGKQLGNAARRTNNVAYTDVLLAPDHTAHGQLGYTDIIVDKGCKPTTSFELKVFAPNDTVAKHAFFPISTCTTGQADLTVSRVEAGAGTQPASS